jgi:hypothetical protein
VAAGLERGCIFPSVVGRAIIVLMHRAKGVRP